MVTNLKEASLSSTGIFPKAEIKNENLVFENLKDYNTALKEGVFFVKIPSDFDISSGIKFCQNFHKEKDDDDPEYTGFHKLAYNDSILGYSDRHDQVEQLQLELSLWGKYFPGALTKLLNQMNNIGLLIIEDIFRKLGISENYWNDITGGARQGTSLQYCIFNHYRALEREVGITKHKDSGFITVLYSPEPGLEAYVKGEWVPIDPEEGYFTINLGHSFEVLTAILETSVIAVDHRVRQIIKPVGKPNRYSFGTYIGPRFDMNLYQYTQDNELKLYQTFLEFQQIKAREMGYEFHPKVKIG